MPKYDIKRGAAIIASVIAEGSQNVEAMGVNEVTMKFTLITPVVFQVGDWCQVYGNKYVVYRKPEYTKVNERQHEYDLYLVHEFYKLQDSLLMGVDKNAQLNEKQFYLTGNLQAFADLVLANANRNDTGWVLGTVDSTDAKTMQFDGENILASLNRIASEFETEFWVEGKTISFTKRLQNSGITLGYGENKGLISISKGNKDANATIFTRLFVEGSERNLPSYTNYGYKRLQLPSANNGKVDNTSAIASFGVIEHYVKFDDIYPKHTGTITSVGDEFTFYDSALPFNINDQLLPGVTAYVAFQTGLLAGYNFDISSFDNATKKFIINENEDERTVTLPNATLKPAVGDKYIVFDIKMPQTHIDSASNELLAKANELLAQGSDIDFNDAFSGNCDPLYFKRNSITPVLGQYARLFETNPAIDVTKRMSRISRDLQNEWKYDITFTDKIQVNTVVREYIKNIEETLVINETKDRTIINRDAVRRAAQRIDILRDDVFDPDGYFDGTHLKPETIEAIMGTFGYKSGNLTLEGVAFSLNVGGVANNFNITAGKLIHFAYDIGGDYTWVMGSMTSSFTDSAQGYYIYAKISKTALTGVWVVNNQKLQVDNETGYYTLLIGRVYPVTNGKREIDLLYGVTNIVGNRIQTGIIQDLAGTNFWNLDTGEMRVSGQITVGAGSNVYNKTEVDGTIQAINNQIIALDGQLANYASDGVLNGIAEKQPIKIAYDAAANEVEDLKTQATALGVSSLDYNAAFINLQNFVLPLLADLTSVSVVDGVQLRDKFNYYGAQKSLLVKNIQAANVNNISRVENYSEINLLTGSKPGKRLEPSEAYVSNQFSVTAGKTYSVAVNTTVSGSTGSVMGWVHPNWAWNFSLPQNSTYGVAQTRTVTFNAPATADNVIVQLQNNNAAGGVVVNWITVVEGGKPMLHWQPNIAETSVTLYNSTNLLKNSNFARGFADWALDGSGHTIETDPVYGNVAKLAYGQAIYANLYPGDTSPEVTVSFYAKGSAGAALMVSSYPPLNIKYPNITTNWERYYVTFKWSSGWELGMKPMSAGMTIWLANIQVEAGPAATAYKVADGDLLKISSEAKLAAENADEAADDLSEYVDGAFKDGVIEAAEAKAIEKYTNIVNETYEQLVNSYNVLYNDALLTGSAKTNLASAKTNLDTSKNTLLSAIANAIADGKTTSAEKAAVDSAYTDFKNKIGAYTTASDNAYKSITDALNVKATDAQTAVASKITFWSSLPTTGQYKVNDLWKPASNVLSIDGVQFIAGKVYKCVATGVFFGDNWKIEETISSGSSLPPTNTAKLNDLFINESDSNKVYVFNGTSWVVKADSRIQEALDASNNAAKIFRGNGSSLPTNYKTGNLFVPTTTFSSGGRQFVGGATYQAITDSATFSQTHWIALSSEEAKQALNEAANALAANEFVDGRRTNNDNPTWYLTNYPRKTRKEFKELNAIGIYGYGTYGGLTTIIPYSDSSAGWVLITQEVTVAQRTFTRTAVDATNWSSWIDLKAETDAANALVPTFMGSAFPSNPKTGSKWFDTATMLWKEWNGSSWVTMTDSDKMTAKYLRDALSKNTDLIGGLILTSVIGVRNSASQVTAYINGNGNTYGEGIAIATGVTDFGLATETQKGVDRHNGSGFRAGNKLWWDKDGNAKVGGFFLLNDKLSSALTGERTEIVSNGIIRGFNSGGNKGYELMSVNGRYALTFYAPDGSVAYKIGQDGSDIPASAESFTPVGMYKFTGLPTTYAALTTAQKSTASSLIKTNSSRSSNIITVSLTMATKYLYDAGNNASTPTNAPYNGYKDSNSDRTDNVSDGWYGLDFPPQFGVIGVYDLVFIQDGKIVSGSNTGVQISYAASLAFLNAGVYIQLAGAKDRHYPTLTLSEAVNDSIEVFYTISEDSTYGTVDGSIVLESGTTATTTAESLGANFLETSPTIEARITITSISITETTAVSDNTDRTITY